MDDNNLDSWLEAKFREYYPDTKSFFVGANDDDCLTLNANDHGMTWTQTLDNMGDGDAEFFVFESDQTGRVITIPLPPEVTAGPFTANVTLSMDIDAYAPSRNDATVDVSEKLVELFREHCGLYDVVQADDKKLIVCLNVEGDFEVIRP